MSQSTVRNADLEAEVGPDAERLDLLDSLATQALSQVAQRARSGSIEAEARASDRLHDAAIGQDRRACSEVAHTLIADGLSAEWLCDVSIPDAIRRMGDEWVSGDLSFSLVTIGSARLQGLLRELDLEVTGSSGHATGSRGAILLVVPVGADHTVGPLVLASQLRRKGFSVRLSLGETSDAVAEAARKTRFDAVFMSATLIRSLPELARVATGIRAAARTAPPVVLGGGIVACAGEARGRASEMFGELAAGLDLSAIDHVTSDVGEAMRFCGFDVAGEC